MPEEIPQDPDQPINGRETTAEEPSPAPAEGSSPGSSRGSAASGPFVADPGSAFDPKSAPAGPELPPSPAEAEAIVAIEWEEEQVRRWLLLQGELGHTFAGVAENDWRYTEADLTSIAGPLSRILNRYDATRAAAAYSDPASVIFGFGMYTIRSAGERRKAIAVLKAAQEQEVPITGVAAPPGSGPPPENVEWQKV
jgi:hypothetical protein